MTEVVLDKVVVHPLVLLSVVDHFSRQATDTEAYFTFVWYFFVNFFPLQLSGFVGWAKLEIKRGW